MHTGHGGAVDFPMSVTVDLRTEHPNGVALNQLKWTVHSNGFRDYTVGGSNDGSTFTTLATLKMNGFGSGMSDGTIYTNDWENDARYTFYQVTILNIRDDQHKQGWAVYSWQWNYV